MARASTRRATAAARKPTGVRVDLSNISKAFEPSQEYAVRCTECGLEEGTKAPYFNLKLQGLEGGEFENSTMYHRASTSESSLWRLRPLLEAFGFDIPEGPLDLEAGDFVGREAMCSTFLDRYDGGSSVKPDEFWALEDGEGSAAAGSADFDLAELDDEQIAELAERMGATGRNPAAKRKSLEKLDVDDLAEAWAELNDAGDGDEPAFDPADLDDDQIMELAEALEVTAKTAARARTQIAKLDADDVVAAWEELQAPTPPKKLAAGKVADAKPTGKPARGGRAKEPDPVTEEDIQEMNEEELEKLVSDFSLDLELGDLKTLRKMKNAVIDAMEEGGHFPS